MNSNVLFFSAIKQALISSTNLKKDADMLEWPSPYVKFLEAVRESVHETSHT